MKSDEEVIQIVTQLERERCGGYIKMHWIEKSIFYTASPTNPNLVYLKNQIIISLGKPLLRDICLKSNLRSDIISDEASKIEYKGCLNAYCTCGGYIGKLRGSVITHKQSKGVGCEAKVSTIFTQIHKEYTEIKYRMSKIMKQLTMRGLYSNFALSECFWGTLNSKEMKEMFNQVILLH